MHPVLRATLLVAPLLPLCALGPLAAAQETQTMAIRIPAPDAILKTLKPGHPRLLADAARFEQLKQAVKTDPLLKAWYAQVRAEAVRILSQPPSTYEIPDGLRLLATSRRVLDRVTDLAFLYRMEGDRKWLDRAWAELDVAAHFKDWNPRHFLDTAEMTNAFAMGYDWLYDGLTPDQRATIREAIIEKGLKAALPTYRLKNWWASARHNWNQVCNGGLGMGALAIGDEAPEVCGLILNEALRSLPLALRQYGPDGAWAEGPGYWHHSGRPRFGARNRLRPERHPRAIALRALPDLRKRTGRPVVQLCGCPRRGCPRPGDVVARKPLSDAGHCLVCPEPLPGHGQGHPLVQPDPRHAPAAQPAAGQAVPGRRSGHDAQRLG